jgi:hypothetical protein
MVTDFERALAVLTGGGVEFIVIGGVAGTLHGSAFITQDLLWTPHLPIRRFRVQPDVLV